jgi:hypothetical protein
MEYKIIFQLFQKPGFLKKPGFSHYLSELTTTPLYPPVSGGKEWKNVTFFYELPPVYGGTEGVHCVSPVYY